MKIFILIIQIIILTLVSMCAFLPMPFAWHFAPKIADKIL